MKHNLLIYINKLHKPISNAPSVKVRGGKTNTIDGPFAETKEQLGGFYIMDAENLDEAIEWVAKLTTAEFVSIECRPATPTQTA